MADGIGGIGSTTGTAILTWQQNLERLAQGQKENDNLVDGSKTTRIDLEGNISQTQTMGVSHFGLEIKSENVGLYARGIFCGDMVERREDGTEGKELSASSFAFGVSGRIRLVGHLYGGLQVGGFSEQLYQVQQWAGTGSAGLKLQEMPVGWIVKDLSARVGVYDYELFLKKTKNGVESSDKYPLPTRVGSALEINTDCGLGFSVGGSYRLSESTSYYHYGMFYRLPVEDRGNLHMAIGNNSLGELTAGIGFHDPEGRILNSSWLGLGADAVYVINPETKINTLRFGISLFLK